MGIVVKVSVGMCVRIDVGMVVVDNVMIDHGIPVVQEMVWLIVHHFVNMMNWLHFMDGLVADNLGRSMNMGMVHIVIQMGRIAIVMVDRMWHWVHMVIAAIDHYSGAMAQMYTIRMMNVAVHKVWQLLVMKIVLQMRQQTRLSYAQQSQSADEELKKTSTIRRKFAVPIFHLAPTFIMEISHLI